MRLLLIDDDDGIRGFSRFVLEEAGYEVLEARDGKEGVRLYRSMGADVVITDMFMPNRDGLDVIMELTHQFPGIKIVATSGGGYNGKLDMLPVARSLGATDVLYKPFLAENLLSTVERALRNVSVN